MDAKYCCSGKIYNQKITVLNKLKKADAQTGLDVWYKTFVEGVAYYTEKTTTANGSTVSMGQTITVLIPFGKGYKPYKEWKQPGAQAGAFTMSQGDIIILGDFVDEIVTASNVVSVKNAYEPNACDVRVITENVNRFGASVQLKVEGV